MSDGEKKKYLCDTCRNRNGDLRTYHRIDSSGIERRYTNNVKVHCKASKKNPNTYRDAVEEVPHGEALRVCGDYRRKGRA